MAFPLRTRQSGRTGGESHHLALRVAQLLAAHESLWLALVCDLWEDGVWEWRAAAARLDAELEAFVHEDAVKLEVEGAAVVDEAVLLRCAEGGARCKMGCSRERESWARQ